MKRRAWWGLGLAVVSASIVFAVYWVIIHNTKVCEDEVEQFQSALYAYRGLKGTCIVLRPVSGPGTNPTQPPKLKYIAETSDSPDEVMAFYRDVMGKMESPTHGGWVHWKLLPVTEPDELVWQVRTAFCDETATLHVQRFGNKTEIVVTYDGRCGTPS